MKILWLFPKTGPNWGIFMNMEEYSIFKDWEVGEYEFSPYTLLFVTQIHHS